MTKTIYILTEGDYEDKNTIGVFDSIELASFAKEQWDKKEIERLLVMNSDRLALPNIDLGEYNGVRSYIDRASIEVARIKSRANLSTIEEYTLNYCWEIQRILTEDDNPENVIDPSTLFVRGHGEPTMTGREYYRNLKGNPNH